MNTNIVFTFDKSFQLFKKHERTLPENIRWKLDYIWRVIEGQQTEKIQNLPLEYQMEIEDLKDVNQKGLKIIFTSIIQTLFHEEIPIDRHCVIKKRGFFKSWTDGFIKYDDTYIYFNASNKTSRYKFKNIDVSLNTSSKRAFDLFYKGSELMTVKFEKPESMHAMYKTIKNMIVKEKNRYDQAVIERLNNFGEKPSKSNLIESKKLSEKVEQPQRRDKNIIREEQKNGQRAGKSGSKKARGELRLKGQMEFERSIISEQDSSMIIRNSKNFNQATRRLKLNPAPEGYQIKQSSQKMFIAFHSKDIKIALQILIGQQGNFKLNQLFSCLCLYRNWNSKIIKEQLCYQMKYQQKAIIYRVYEKSSSLLSKSRQTYTILQYKKLSPNTAILVEESLDNQDRPQEYTRAYLRTIFFIQTYQDSLKICIQSEFDPKGFCSQTESQQLLLSIYKDIVHFQNYLSEFSIKQDKSSENLLFEDIEPQYSSNQTIQIPNNILIQNQIGIGQVQHQKSSDEQDEKNVKKTLQIYRRSKKRDPFFELKPDSPIMVPTLEYLELLRKKQHEKYYLKHRFTFDVVQKYDDYIPSYCLEQMLKRGGQYEITANLELLFINQKLIQSQKDILRFLIRQIGANLISGKSVLNVSLPVDIFQPRTLLERSASSFGKCPDYLLRACQSNPLEQIMNVSAFIASVPTLELIMQKPFNPILGQTFQCYLKGIPLYYEQISHHPPISSYFMQCSQFKMYGNLIAFADVGLNSGVGGNLGVMHIVFKNGYHYECYFPPSEISGLIYGDRKFRSYGRGYIVQRSQNLFAQFSIEKQKKGIYEAKDKLLPGSIIGGIFKVNKKFIDFLDSYNQNLKKFPGISKQHIVQKLVHIHGMWFDKIYMNETIITHGVRAYPVQYYPFSLPSDANFRLDVLYHKQNNLPESQKEKEILQNIQREDRKLRQKYEKQMKKPSK